eukprot:2323171-Rhodomonas_salina.3
MGYQPTRLLQCVRYCNSIWAYYASDTDIAYGLSAYALSGTDIAYVAGNVPFLLRDCRSVLLPAYGTGLHEVRSHNDKARSELARPKVSSYAISGTDLAYGAMRALCDGRYLQNTARMRVLCYARYSRSLWAICPLVSFAALLT